MGGNTDKVISKFDKLAYTEIKKRQRFERINIFLIKVQYALSFIFIGVYSYFFLF